MVRVLKGKAQSKKCIISNVDYLPSFKSQNSNDRTCLVDQEEDGKKGCKETNEQNIIDILFTNGLLIFLFTNVLPIFLLVNTYKETVYTKLEG